jgi:hypothetical protein
VSGLKRLYRALGPAWSAAVGVALAAGVVAVVAVAATGSGSAPRRPAASVPSVRADAAPPSPAAQRPASGSKRHRAKPHKRPASHRSHKAKTHTNSTPATTTTSTTTATSPAPATTSPSGSVTVDLHGGGDATVTACGETHHDKTYAAGTAIAFSGTVSPIPQARWKVKLQIKICAGGTYIDVMKLDATRNKHTGGFSGTFTALPRGLYYARVELYVNDSEVSDSDKVHFKTH